jgi:hypothetical protein
MKLTAFFTLIIFSLFAAELPQQPKHDSQTQLMTAYRL